MFIDEAQIRVEAGKGGAGCLSFRREKHTPRGGPDGGDGGRGGSIYIIGDAHLNTLVDFQHHRSYRAQNGRPGAGRDATGRDGEDLEIRVPLGTMIQDADTRELIDEITESNQRVLVVKGGSNGVGNARFKSSTNRSPRKTIPGGAGEVRMLKLELRILADVGLVGLPNAGKSSLIRKVTNAQPKIADYPFTTLKPSRGVVGLGYGRSYTIADIPGLIEGASTGSGLGIQFLKHLRHTRLLFHIVDIFSTIDVESVAESIDVIANELAQFDEDLAKRERWLVLNKIDLVSEAELENYLQEIIAKSHWSGRWFAISAVTGSGCKKLVGEAMNWLEDNSPEPNKHQSIEELLL